MKKFFSLKINKAVIDKKSQIIQKETISYTRRDKIRKNMFYFFGFSFVSLYAFYLMKASGLMKSLEIDKKYKNRQKKIQEKYNVDIELNDKKLKEFDEKWGINKAIDEFENKIKYGNKELNKKEEEDSDKKNAEDNNISEISSEKIEISRDNENKIEIVKGKDYEQLKYYQGKEENFDPTKMGNTIIFDSRLDRNIMKK